MLQRVPDTLDKREGSVIYDALAPAALALKNAYVEMDGVLSQTFIKTASGEYLDMRAEDFNAERASATYAVLKGEFNLDIPLGSRFNGGELNYRATEKIAAGAYRMECETAGTAGNAYLGSITPVEYIPGLNAAALTEVLIPAQDEEGDNEFRERILENIMRSVQDGNQAQYLKWAAEFDGVGRAKVFPLWNGVNTVKVSILDNDNGPASPELISDFQEYLDPESRGLGSGIAPIGSMVTVSTASVVTLNISLDAELKEGYSEAAGVRDAIDAWLNELSYEKDSVSFYGLAALILSCGSVERIENFSVNQGTGDILLGGEEIPRLGVLSIGVI